MGHGTMRRLLIVGAGVCFISGFSTAQELAPNDTLDTVYLKEIVVTATRAGGEVLNVPMAVTLVDVRDFARTKRLSMAEVLWAVPGVLAQSRSGGHDVRLTIRGFGARGNADRSNAATIRGIKVLLDGIPETEPDGRTALDLIDVSTVHRIEVVRSNASTLFGNASGGVINIETLPWLQHASIESRNSVGSFGLRRNNVSVYMPASWGRSSMSITSSAFDGWREHSSSKATLARAAAVIESGEHDRLHLAATTAQVQFNIPGPLTLDEYRSNPQQANRQYLARRERRHNRLARLSFQMEKRVAEDHSLELVGYVGPKVLQRSERNTFRDFNRFHIGGGALYRWKSTRGILRHIIVGGDGAYQDGSILFYSLVNGERGDSLRTNKREAAATAGLFAQAELSPLQRTTVVSGIRYDIQRYTTELLPAGQRLRRLPESLSFHHLTPRIGFSYRLDTLHSVYLNLSGGLEVPAFNEVDPPPSRPDLLLNPILKPMSSTTFETGLKGFEFFPAISLLNSFTYSIAAYAIFINNEIVPFDGGAWFNSAGSSRRYGVEVGTQLDFRWGISWKSALTYLDARYREYRNDLGNFKGKRVPGISPLVFNSRVRFQSPYGFSVEMTGEYVHRYPADDVNQYHVPSAFVLGASVGYDLQLEGFHITLFAGGQNLANERYSASAFINPVTRTSAGLPVDPSFLEPGLPRNVFFGFDAKVSL
jgi:iron complex outermembrane receptor protein